MSAHEHVKTMVVGAGPAGMALLAAARDEGVLDHLLEHGMWIVESETQEGIGAGRLRDYEVRSDTTGRVFVECVTRTLAEGQTAGLSCAVDASDPLVKKCDRDGPVELSVAAALLSRAGAILLDTIRKDADREVILPGRAIRIRREADRWAVAVETPSGILTSTSDTVVLATGGIPYIPPMLARAGRRSRLVHSDRVLRGLLSLRSGFRRYRTPRIVIVGGSHSAFSAAKVLLQFDSGRWSPGAIEMLHRRPVRVTYSDTAAARADGADFDTDDICPVTGRVHRFGGLRGDSADLWRSVRDGMERRINVVPIPPAEGSLERMIGDADLVIAATGYRSSAGPLLPSRMRSVAASPSERFDGRGRLLDGGEAVPGIYGIGLGAGRRRDDSTGGEASFSGPIDGVWFYQHVVATALLSELIGNYGM